MAAAPGNAAIIAGGFLDATGVTSDEPTSPELALAVARELARSPCPERRQRALAAMLRIENNKTNDIDKSPLSRFVKQLCNVSSSLTLLHFSIGQGTIDKLAGRVVRSNKVTGVEYACLATICFILLLQFFLVAGWLSALHVLFAKLHIW